MLEFTRREFVAVFSRLLLILLFLGLLIPVPADAKKHETGFLDPCCWRNSAFVNPALPCLNIAMIGCSLCHVPFICGSPLQVSRELTF